MSAAKSAVSLLVAMGTFTLAMSAVAQDRADAAPPARAIEVSEGGPSKDEAVVAPAAPHLQRFSFGLGFVGASVEHRGYDPYSTDNSLPMATLFGTFTPWPTRPVSLHLAFGWDYGGSTAMARGNESSITIHRIAVGLEGRYTPISRMALFVRAVPSAMHVEGLISDPYLPAKLGAGVWTWGVDLTGGASARVAAFGDREYPSASIWLGLDMGYRFAGTAAMRFRPGELSQEDQTRRFGEVALPDLDLSGFVARLHGSISF